MIGVLSSNGAKHRLFLVEDDLELALLMKNRLESEGFSVTHLSDGLAAVSRIPAEQPDMVVLDVMLPGMNGFEVLMEARKNYAGPILMLTALDDDLDQITGLENGADDYVTKPVRPRVLLSRINALLRRSGANARCGGQLKVGPLTIDAARREAWLQGARLGLTTTEFDLLYFMAKNSGRVLSRNDINLALHNTEYDGIDRSIDVYISRIRQKLGDDPEVPSFVKTVRGAGYLLAEPTG